MDYFPQVRVYEYDPYETEYKFPFNIYTENVLKLLQNIIIKHEF